MPGNRRAVPRRQGRPGGRLARYGKSLIAFEERAVAAERLLQLSRKERLAGGGPKIRRVQRAGKPSRSKRRRRRGADSV